MTKCKEPIYFGGSLVDFDNRRIRVYISFVLGEELYTVPFYPTNVQSEVTTLSVSDSEDNDDLMECSSSHTQLAKT